MAEVRVEAAESVASPVRRVLQAVRQQGTDLVNSRCGLVEPGYQ